MDVCVDTALYVVMGNETKEDSNLVCFTELRDKERFVWRGVLIAGSFLLLPFTTGCRLMKRPRETATKSAQLVNRTLSGEMELTKEFKAALSDIFEVIDLDGNGLLSLEEYNFFEQRASGEKCNEDAWAICKAVQRSISSKAEAKSLKGHGSVLVYTYKGENRISSVIANKETHRGTVVHNAPPVHCLNLEFLESQTRMPPSQMCTTFFLLQNTNEDFKKKYPSSVGPYNANKW